MLVRHWMVEPPTQKRWGEHPPSSHVCSVTTFLAPFTTTLKWQEPSQNMDKINTLLISYIHSCKKYYEAPARHSSRLWDTISLFSVEPIVYRGSTFINKIITKMENCNAGKIFEGERQNMMKVWKAEGFYLVWEVRGNSSEKMTLGSEA